MSNPLTGKQLIKPINARIRELQLEIDVVLDNLFQIDIADRLAELKQLRKQARQIKAEHPQEFKRKPKQDDNAVKAQTEKDETSTAIFNASLLKETAKQEKDEESSFKASLPTAKQEKDNTSSVKASVPKEASESIAARIEHVIAAVAESIGLNEQSKIVSLEASPPLPASPTASVSKSLSKSASLSVDKPTVASLASSPKEVVLPIKTDSEEDVSLMQKLRTKVIHRVKHVLPVQPQMCQDKEKDIVKLPSSYHELSPEVQQKLQGTQPLTMPQMQALDLWMRVPGLLAFFGIGTGKTRLAASCAYVIWQAFRAQADCRLQIIFVASVSLLGNFRREWQKLVRVVDAHELLIPVEFWSYTQLRLQIERLKVQASLLQDQPKRYRVMIVDEAHNLRNETESVETITQYINNPRHIQKILLLTGTPIVNQISDFTMLMATVSRQQKPLDAALFEQLLFAKKQSRALLDYLSCRQVVYLPDTRNDPNFPQVRTFYHMFLLNDQEQHQFAQVKNNTQNFFGLHEAITTRAEKKKEWIVGFLKHMVENQTQKALFFSENLEILQYVYEQCTGLRRQEKLLKPTVIKAKVGQRKSPREKPISPEEAQQAAMAERAAKSFQLPARLMDGEISDPLRNEYVKDFNEGKVRVLIVSKVGTEGFDLKGCTDVVLLDPSWTSVEQDQVIGRAVRYRSHENFLTNQVNVHHLLVSNRKDDQDKVMGTPSASFWKAVDLYFTSQQVKRSNIVDLVKTATVKQKRELIQHATLKLIEAYERANSCNKLATVRVRKFIGAAV